jgi:hypothetical protein
LKQLSSLPEEVVENIEDLDVTLKTVKELYVNMQKILKAQHTLHDDWMRVDELLGNELNVRLKLFTTRSRVLREKFTQYS